MAKAKLTDLTKKWISGKTKKQNNIKTETIKTQSHQDSNEKIRQTVYITKKVNRLLWLHRINTGQTVSKAVEELVLKHIKVDSVKV